MCQQEVELRKAYWAALFRSLGDVVHLIQDMAQPQDMRYDAYQNSQEVLNDYA